jgi:hypothetical protein
MNKASVLGETSHQMSAGSYQSKGRISVRGLVLESEAGCKAVDVLLGRVTEMNNFVSAATAEAMLQQLEAEYVAQT